MINVIERFNLKWENGELKKYKVQYQDYTGDTRNYFPDFIIEGKYMVECKPKRLWDTPKVISKKEGAIKFCEERGMKYKLVEITKIKTKEMIELYLSGAIKFTDKYDKKFKETYIK